MANNGKDEASGSTVNSPSNVPTSNQARLAALEAGHVEIQMERRENNDGREGQGHVNENPGRFRRGGRVKRGQLRVEHWVDHEDEN
ncbi:hypothetical protein JRO89_XS14G0128300 [Xanthoceras sorbifolium]|uniref:Uncharacterized protein n=1 Tax=Xanthoceras sorbifolium TaxID=99658 RepID=A0ABQ8H566_9ROSI|nr:hypothetical protein JRO89_XS14G0128300 [Xanthoceras sorbifolium]